MEKETVTKTNHVQTTCSDRDPARTSEATTTNLDWPDLKALGLQRVKEFIHDALRGKPAYAAALDTSSGLLFKALFQLDTAIDEALHHTTDPLDRIDGVARAIDLMLRLTRQIDRFGRLRHLLLEARQALPERDAQ